MGRVAVVTGAGRGIGLELTRQLLEGGATVFACTRVKDSEGLDPLSTKHGDRLQRITLDVADETAVKDGVRIVAGRVDHIDILINNAGVYPSDDGGLEQLDLDAMRQGFEVNALGAIRVTRGFLPLMRQGTEKKIFLMTSLMGSIGDNGSGGSYAYRVSKTALTMISRNLAHELRTDGFVVLAIHPGWVQTRMGGGAASLPVEESVQGILQLLDRCGAEESGSFRSWDGRILPF